MHIGDHEEVKRVVVLTLLFSRLSSVNKNVELLQCLLECIPCNATLGAGDVFGLPQLHPRVY